LFPVAGIQTEIPTLLDIPSIFAHIPDIPVIGAPDMGMDLMARYDLPVADRAATARGADVLRQRTASDPVELAVTHADGTRQSVALPAAATRIVADILTKLSAAGNVAVLAGDAEVSPEDAAAILGISRPLVRRRMDSGRLPFRRVGAHRRLRLSDVLELKRQEAPVRDALDELQADTEGLTALGL
jgi:excisionase family DNA binding protein